MSFVRIAGVPAAIAACAAMTQSAPAQDVIDASYSLTQIESGKRVYDLECASCHGTILDGSEAGGALAGSAFIDKWTELSVGSLDTVVRSTMPLDAPDSLSGTQYENVLAYMLHRNGMVQTRTQPKGAPVARSENAEWLHHRGNPGSQNYSPLSLIDRNNVAELEVVWRWRSDNFGPGIYPNLQTTPIMADGVLYATAGSRRTVVAIDAKTGETLWVHRIEEGRRGENAPRKDPGRGVAFRRDGDVARVYVITPGYQLVALDAASGRPDEGFGSNGTVDLKLAHDQQLDPELSRIGASSPPIIVGDVIIVGAAFPSGATPPTKEMPAGNIAAYDVRTGERRWVFHTIPRPGEFGHDTWEDNSWSYTGNVGVWAPMSADPDLSLVYLPVEAPTGDYYGGHRPGDNLFSQSLVCLDAATGERVWHFQTVHHGIWDYDLPAAPILLDVDYDGETIPIVAQITKQGFTFVFDRRDGTPIWPIEEREVPGGDVPGETYAPTQPFPTLPVPFAMQGTGPESLNNLTPEIYAEALRILSQGRHGPLFTPPSVKTDKNIGTFFAPSPSGGGNWQGGVADPESGVLFVSSANTINVIGLFSDPDWSNMRYIRYERKLPGPFGLPLAKPTWGTITAIDLRTGKHLWQIANGDTPDYVKDHPKLEGVEIPRTGHFERGGLLVTKTLLFAGEGSGLYGMSGGGTKFRAHDKRTGEILAEIDLGARQSGIPMTFAIDGRQYIVLAAGAPNLAGQLIALSTPD